MTASITKIGIMTLMLTVLCLLSPSIKTLSMTKLIRTVLNETTVSITIKMRHSAQYYVLTNGAVKPNVLIVVAAIAKMVSSRF